MLKGRVEQTGNEAAYSKVGLNATSQKQPAEGTMEQLIFKAKTLSL